MTQFRQRLQRTFTFEMLEPFRQDLKTTERSEFKALNKITPFHLSGFTFFQKGHRMERKEVLKSEAGNGLSDLMLTALDQKTKS